MNKNILSTLLLSFIVFSLTACGGGSGGSGSSGAAAVLATITLSGDDTSELGTTSELNYYAFREDFFGADLFLSATSSGSAMNVVRVGLGELSSSVIDPDDFANDEANAVIFNIMDMGLSIRINKDGDSYLYSLTCVSACTGVQFDTATRTLTLDDVVLAPTIGGDANSQATASLTLNGTIIWAESDEDPDAPANQSNTSSSDTGTSNVTLADIVGVWDSSIGSDENYTAFRSNGTYVDYDYQGDAFDMGENCYDVYPGTIEDLGNGRFRLDDSDRVGTFSFSGDDLRFQAPEGTYSLSSTSLSETDLVPECD